MTEGFASGKEATPPPPPPLQVFEREGFLEGPGPASETSRDPRPHARRSQTGAGMFMYERACCPPRALPAPGGGLRLPRELPPPPHPAGRAARKPTSMNPIKGSPGLCTAQFPAGIYIWCKKYISYSLALSIHSIRTRIFLISSAVRTRLGGGGGAALGLQWDLVTKGCPGGGAEAVASQSSWWIKAPAQPGSALCELGLPCLPAPRLPPACACHWPRSRRLFFFFAFKSLSGVF